MAEVLGVAASVIAVIQLTGKVVSLAYEYLGGVKRASDDLRNLVNELHALGGVLIAMKDFADANPESKTLELLNGQGGPLPGCLQELQRGSMRKK